MFTFFKLRQYLLFLFVFLALLVRYLTTATENHMPAFLQYLFTSSFEFHILYST